jgi:hypothetical protein
MAYLPKEDHDALHAECCNDIQAALDARSQTPDGHRVVGAALPFSLTPEVVELVARNTLDTVLRLSGPMLLNFATVNKAAIRKVVTPLALQTLDQAIHLLQDAS